MRIASRSLPTSSTALTEVTPKTRRTIRMRSAGVLRLDVEVAVVGAQSAGHSVREELVEDVAAEGPLELSADRGDLSASSPYRTRSWAPTEESLCWTARFRLAPTHVDDGGPGSSGPSDPWQRVLGALVPVLEERLRSAGATVEPGWVESQLDLTGGSDWDIALPLHRPAKSAGANAEELARRLAPEFPATLGVRAVVALGSYLNFSLDAGWFADETLSIVRARGARFGHWDSASPPACVEHTSANPTGPFHVGRVRNGIIGDTLARVLRAAGAPVTTQYYVDDVGRQAAMVTWIWSKPVEQWPPEIRASLDETGGRVDPQERADLRYGRPYPLVSTYLKSHPEAAAEVAELSRRLEAGDAPPLHKELAEATLAGMIALPRADRRSPSTRSCGSRASCATGASRGSSAGSRPLPTRCGRRTGRSRSTQPPTAFRRRRPGSWSPARTRRAST